MNRSNFVAQIREAKNLFAGSVLIAAHHYQPPEIVELADVVGDSYRLSIIASESSADSIIICGVRFMAESAAILARQGQQILIPDFTAGCPMADMTTRSHAEHALVRIAEIIGEEPVPVTYMNCWVDLKALTGARGGSVCTSGNAKKIMAYFLKAGRRVLFMPDKNLGMNTALALGLSEKDMCQISSGGDIFSRDPTDAQVFLWDGYCPVHEIFTADQLASARRDHLGVHILVHPECSPSVVQGADAAESTEGMASQIACAGARSVTVVGTEYRFIERMISQYPDRQIFPLEKTFCRDMDMITLEKLHIVLQGLTSGVVDPYIVRLNELDRKDAKRALTTMIDITEGK